MENALNLDTVLLSEDKKSVVILDQTLLPNECKYLTLDKAEDIWEAIYSPVSYTHLNHDKVVQLVVAGGLDALPGLALLELAVSQQAVHLAGVPLPLPGLGGAGGDGHGLAQGASGVLKAGGVLGADHLHIPAVHIELVQGGGADPAHSGQGAVDHRGVVAAGDKEPVLVRGGQSVVGAAPLIVHVVRAGHPGEGDGVPLTHRGPQLQDLGVQGGDDLRRGTGLGQVAAAGLQGDAQNLLADLVGDGLGLCLGVTFFRDVYKRQTVDQVEAVMAAGTLGELAVQDNQA